MTQLLNKIVRGLNALFYKLLQQLKLLVRRRKRIKKRNTTRHASTAKSSFTSTDRLLHKKYLDRLAKLNENLSYLDQRTASSGKQIKKQNMIKHTRKKVERQSQRLKL
jgi:hypothetical protein